MGLKTTIGVQGVVTEKSDTDQLVMNAPVKNKVTVFAVSQSATVTDAFNLFNPHAEGVTGSLPVISDDNVGSSFTFLKNAGSNPLLVSGANSITEGGAWTYEATTAGETYAVMAVSGVTGFYWHVV